VGINVKPGINDLATTHPVLASEWSYERNAPLRPDTIIAGTRRKIWWVCRLGHEWQAAGYNRVIGTGCPVCAGKLVWAGFNDLETIAPDVAREFNVAKNAPLNARTVLAGANKKYWWKCTKGHEWQTSCNSRTGVKKSNCPFCTNQRVQVGFNDLATTNPTLANEWNKKLNSGATPITVVAGSTKLAWWTCSSGHDYQATVAARLRGRGCTICAGKKVIQGINDMGTTHPNLASQWDYEKNGTLQPFDFVAGTTKKLWWRCELGHEWNASGANRIKGENCPTCIGKKVLQGFNDLASTNPQIAREWHPTRNIPMLPTEVVAGTNKKIWWICSLGHEWEQSGNVRLAGTGCPICSGNRVLVGVNDLATTDPEIARQWHPTKNGTLLPTQVVTGTTIKIWWQCDQGHVWQTFGYARKVSGCPSCAEYGFNPGMPSVVYFLENEKLNARKIGITNMGTSRIDSFVKKGWAVLALHENIPGHVAQKVEASMFKWIRQDLGLPAFLGSQELPRIGGWTETFTNQGPSNKLILKRLQSELESRNSEPEKHINT
jgi:Probable Zinc-ribbon domain